MNSFGDLYLKGLGHNSKVCKSMYKRNTCVTIVLNLCSQQPNCGISRIAKEKMNDNENMITKHLSHGILHTHTHTHTHTNENNTMKFAKLFVKVGRWEDIMRI
jgi:hypothetical protein